MGTISVTLPADGDTIDAADVNTPINTIVTAINGNLDSNNIASGGVATANLATGISIVGKESNPYKFRVRRVAAQNTSAGTATKINFDTEDFDTNNNFDSTTNYRYTAPVSGFYHIDAFAEHASSNQGLIYLYKNGTSIAQGNHFNTGLNTQGLVVTDTLQLTAGDYLEVFMYTDNTVALSVTAGLQPRFSGFLISTT